MSLVVVLGSSCTIEDVESVMIICTSVSSKPEKIDYY
jgi:hypothetical protein